MPRRHIARHYILPDGREEWDCTCGANLRYHVEHRTSRNGHPEPAPLGAHT